MARLHRTYLYAPGTRPEVMIKAASSGADAVILDLEDSVAPADKVSARQNIAGLLSGGGFAEATADIHVRINRDENGYDTNDVHAVVSPGLSALRLPKTTTGDEVAALDARLADIVDIDLPRPRELRMLASDEAGVHVEHIRTYFNSAGVIE